MINASNYMHILYHPEFDLISVRFLLAKSRIYRTNFHHYRSVIILTIVFAFPSAIRYRLKDKHICKFKSIINRDTFTYFYISASCTQINSPIS